MPRTFWGWMMLLGALAVAIGMGIASGPGTSHPTLGMAAIGLTCGGLLAMLVAMRRMPRTPVDDDDD